MPIEIGDSTATVRSKINAVLTDAGLNPADNVDTTAATTLLNQVAGLWDVDVEFVDRMPEAEFRADFSALKNAGVQRFASTSRILGAGGLDYAFYDYSTTALDRMWREATGQTPAALSSPVGLAVGREKQGRKSFAEVMAGQPELIQNGGFSNGLDGWNNPSGMAEVVNGRARVTSTSTEVSASGRIVQIIPCVVGGLYQVTVTGYAVNGNPRLAVGTSNGNTSALSELFSPGTITRYFIATQATMHIMGWTSGTTAGLSAEFDDFSVKQVPAHYASQAINASRPTLQSDDLKFDGSDDNLLTDWFAQAGANCIIAQVTVPATLSGTHVIAGTNSGGSDRWNIRLDSIGRVYGGVGDLPAISLLVDLRGLSAFIALGCDNSAAILFCNGAATSSAKTGQPLLTSANRIGAGGASSPSQFWPGSIQRMAFGRVFPTEAQLNQIWAEWLAAA